MEEHFVARPDPTAHHPRNVQAILHQTYAAVETPQMKCEVIQAPNLVFEKSLPFRLLPDDVLGTSPNGAETAPDVRRVSLQVQDIILPDLVCKAALKWFVAQGEIELS